MKMIIKALARWPEKEGSRYGGPTFWKKNNKMVKSPGCTSVGASLCG